MKSLAPELANAIRQCGHDGHRVETLFHAATDAIALYIVEFASGTTISFSCASPYEAKSFEPHQWHEVLAGIAKRIFCVRNLFTPLLS